MRHNEVLDTFANLMKDVRFDVELELKFQPLEGEFFGNRTTKTMKSSIRQPVQYW